LNFEYKHLKPLLTGEQSRQLDQITIESIGIDGFTLMETAGKGAADVIIEFMNDQLQSDRQGITKQGRKASKRQKIRTLCLCGKGNNAGDALVAARYLTESGHFQVDLCMIAGTEHLSPDTERNLNLFRQYSPDSILHETLDQALYPNTSDQPRYELILDGLLGSGITSPLREPFLSAIRKLNDWKETQHQVWVISMDVPSGLDATTGESTGSIINADLTVTFGPKKTGFLLADGPRYSGRVIPVPLAFPLHLHHGGLHNFDLSDRDGISGPVIPHVRRSSDTRHKYDDGVVYVIGGSPGLTGAAIMASRAAWKKGAGAVFLITPDALLSSYETEVPEMIKIQTGTGNSQFQPDDVTSICRQLEARPGAVLLGPGLGMESVSNGFLKQFIHQMPDLPLVLDADALRGWNIQEFPNWIGSDFPSCRHSPIVLTPHPGEAEELFAGFQPGEVSEKLWGKTPDSSSIRRLQIAAEVTARYQLTICSKGDPVGVSGYSNEGFVNEGYSKEGSTSNTVFQVISDYPTEGFHRAGFGDILSGQIAVNLSFRADPTHAVLDALLYGFERWKESNDHLSRIDQTVSPEDIL